MTEEKEKINPWDKSGQWPEELDLLKSIIARLPLVETKKWGGPVYTYNGKNIIGIGAFKSYVAIWFFNGCFLKDENKVLISAQQGVTKALRQWRFASRDDIQKQEDLIKKYVLESISCIDSGIVHKPEKKPEIVCDLMKKTLQADAQLDQAFNKFTPFKKREFLEFIEAAKCEETRLARLEKIKPMILQGIGLNDKYRK
jgi:uncharacterized protein YdeI (YjbR/CyaY-like superfamily)